MGGAGPLAERRILVPRGGDIGARLSAAIEAEGGVAVVAPAIDFREPVDDRPVVAAFEQLAAGRFDWLAITSATTVEVLARHRALVPDATRVAAVGSATSEALAAAGYRTDFVPRAAFTATAMVAEWPHAHGRVLIPQSAIAEPTLATGLTGLGMQVTTVTAYETVELPLGDDVVHQLNSGGFDAVLLTSASIARAIASQARTLAEGTVIACIGETTGAAAVRAGLPVHVVAESSGADSLVHALSRHLAETTPPSRK